MVRKVYEVNPVPCPECGAEMKIITFIEDCKVMIRSSVTLRFPYSWLSAVPQ